jgi:hypothetical protein
MRLMAWMTATTIDCFCVVCVDSQASTKKPPSQVAFLLQTVVKLGHNAELQRSEFEDLFA